jgi:hypothetical protein
MLLSSKKGQFATNKMWRTKNCLLWKLCPKTTMEKWNWITIQAHDQRSRSQLSIKVDNQKKYKSGIKNKNVSNCSTNTKIKKMDSLQKNQHVGQNHKSVNLSINANFGNFDHLKRGTLWVKNVNWRNVPNYHIRPIQSARGWKTELKPRVAIFGDSVTREKKETVESRMQILGLCQTTTIGPFDRLQNGRQD